MKILALVVSLSAALVLTGCAVKTSGVKKVGPDTYTVSADHLNASTAKASVLEQAGSIVLIREKSYLSLKP